ncbi:helix-turn-helix transcriptional regulator [Streptomyces sp. NBC_01808]|uniref:winged helix-turn-helix transcriptional regulator n=1 Tax=Streptomyces sp. NBC_01808 TaxID=2975947 RepID=UPI002DD7DE8F|nr:helix-turn-helix domain-containing protein [Streptomyces sp. NBC_01808]WSA42256.1 helix-turn-helix transcriptional regulator [Streptomyces sp. NBC_01808]
MRFDRPGDVFLADCPARLTLEVISDKWSMVTLYALGSRPWRHGELRELIGGVSSKVLTQTLRRLERYGMVRRHEYAEVPRRVEYELTELGRTLLPAIAALTTWAEQHGAAVIEALDGHGALDGAGGPEPARRSDEAPARASASA